MASCAPSNPARRMPHEAGRLARVLTVVALGTMAAAAARAERMLSYAHVATVENISLGTTELDHPAVNGNPAARIFVTQNWNPSGRTAGPYNDHAIGVRLVGAGEAARWVIYNEDGATMPVGAGFNVVIADTDTRTFLHLTSAEDIVNRANYLECEYGDLYICSNSGLLLIHSHAKNPLGLSGGDFDHPSSILYGSPTWTLVTENDPLELMPGGVFFWFLVGAQQFDAAAAGRAFLHTATAGTLAFNYTLLGSDELAGRPGAVFLAVRNGPAASNHPEHFGVWYDWLYTGTWAIFHQDETPIEEGARFHIYIPPALSDDFESGDLDFWSTVVGAP